METNPYNYTRPVTNPSMFFGRWELVEKLRDGLTASNPCCYALYGGRRCGKTSVMRMVEAQLNGRLDAGIRPVVVPLFMNMQLDPPTCTADFFERLLRRLLEWQSSLAGDQISLPAIRKGSPATSFAEAFRELYRAVQPEIGGVNLAILVDESEKLHRPEWARKLESNLRALISDTPGVRGHLGLIMTGGIDFYHDMIAPTDGSPLRNILDEEIHLPPASQEAMLDLVTKPTHGNISDQVADEVIRQAGGHLFLGQFIMRNLWDQGFEDADDGLVQDMAACFPRKRRDYESWLDSIGPESQKVYDFLVACGRSCGRREISSELGINRLDTQKALDILSFHNLIDKEKRNYICRTEMFRAWYADNILAESDRTEQRPLEVFISYAHEDEALCDLLKKHLATLERQKVIETWHDRRIRPGQVWADKIDQHIRSADRKSVV